MRRAGMHGESAELVNGRRSPRRGLDGAVMELRDSHFCVWFGCVGGCLRRLYGREEQSQCIAAIIFLSSLVHAGERGQAS
jgi:hypothetical protein